MDTQKPQLLQLIARPCNARETQIISALLASLQQTPEQSFEEGSNPERCKKRLH